MKESVTSYMTRKLITFTPDIDIQDAIKSLLTNRISGAPVVDRSGRLVGMLSEKDCIRVLIDGDYNQRPTGQGTVSDYMSRRIKTLPASASIQDAAEEFLNSPYRRFPVLDGKKLVGQISRRDVLTAIDKRRPKVSHVPSSWKARVPIM
ncbi:MAG: CBS domain-containing protein [Bacteroidota bacterium]